MRETRIRLLVVDDHEVVRAGIRRVLDREDDIDVVGEARSGEEALEILPRARPDVVLLDQRLPGMSGAETCSQILQRAPRTAVIILSSFVTDEVVDACISAGARGYLTKDLASVDLAASVRAGARGGAVLAPEVCDRVISWARRSSRPIRPARLKSEEVEVLGLAAQGLSNRAIATELCVSPATVKVRLRNAMRKLGASRRTDAVTAGIEQGVI